MVLTIILVSLFAVSAVSATDNATSDVVGVEDTALDVVKQTTDDVGIEDQNNNIVKCTENQDNNEVGAAEGNGLNGNVGTFSNLTAEINNAKHELNLTRNYTFTKIGTTILFLKIVSLHLMVEQYILVVRMLLFQIVSL